MSWIPLTIDHIKARVSEDEIECYETVGRKEGDEVSRITGPAGIIYQLTLMIRAKVSACRENVLGPDGTIPEECLHAAVSIARHNIVSTPDTGSEDENRNTEFREANFFLRDVSRCDIGIVNPDGGVAGNSSGCFGGDERREF